MSETDSLTGLPNRARFLESLRHAVEAAKVHGNTLAVLYVDLDNFRRINDVLGHLVGDELIRRASLRFREILRRDDEIARAPDSPADFEVARLGGDQFIVLLHSIRDVEGRRHRGCAHDPPPGHTCRRRWTADHPDRKRWNRDSFRRRARGRGVAAPVRHRDVQREAAGTRRLCFLRRPDERRGAGAIQPRDAARGRTGA